MKKTLGCVSIIMKTKNRELFLERAIKSVLKQKYNHWQLILINDGGNPRKVNKIVNKLKGDINNRLILKHNKKSLGMGASNNIGIKISSGNYIAIHDDDDSWHPKFLERSIEILETEQYDKTKPFGVASHIVKIIEDVDIKNKKIKIIRKEPFNMALKDLSIFDIAGANRFAPISFIYKRCVLKNIGYYDESLNVIEDWDFNLRFLMKYDIAVLQEPLAYYHYREGIKSGPLGNCVVIEGKNKTKFLQNKVKNKYLREDIKNKTFGIGFLLSIAQSDFETKKRLDKLEKYINSEF